MAKTATIMTRVDPEVKARAEHVLKKLGIPMATAIEMYLRQVADKNRIPFELSVTKVEKPKAFGDYTKEELEALFDKSFKDYEEGRVMEASKFREEFEKRHGIK